jgi:hypothetical protein
MAMKACVDCGKEFDARGRSNRCGNPCTRDKNAHRKKDAPTGKTRRPARRADRQDAPTGKTRRPARRAAEEPAAEPEQEPEVTHSASVSLTSEGYVISVAGDLPVLLRMDDFSRVSFAGLG